MGKETTTASYPELVDNRDGNTLSRALRRAIEDLRRSESSLKEVRIATAFFSPSGFFQISEPLSKAGRTRLMLGADLPSDPASSRKQLDESQSRFEERRLKAGFEKLEKALSDEQARAPFTRDGTRAIRNLIGILKAGNVEVRRYEKTFLHAKTYILTSAAPEELPGKPAEMGVIVGSSNLTYAGLTTNLELNLARQDARVIRQAVQWFDSLWEEAEPYDLVELYEEMVSLREPWEIFLSVLWRLYGEEMDQEPEDTGDLPLTSFQKHGVFRALKLIEKNGGVIVADEVGLGKTFIAGEILQMYWSRRQRALLICPAALRDGTWKKFLSKYQMYAECFSYEQLAHDSQLSKRPTGGKEHLQRHLDEYQLVIVDEAHNYRNPDSPTRAGTLRSLLSGKQRDVLFLTATPVNNSLWDLYHLIRFFMKQDACLADRGILSIRERFAAAMQTDPSDLNPDLLYPIVDATTVKRTRQFVQKHYAGDTIEGPDGIPQTIVFPKPIPITVRYELDGILPGFFDEIEQALDPDSLHAVTFSRYMVKKFLFEENEEEELAREKALVGLIRSGILKRFESSAWAFQKTVRKMAREHGLFLQALDEGKILTTEFFQEFSADDSVLETLLEESGNTLDASDYDVESLREVVTEDMEKLDSLAKKAERITAENDTKLHRLAHELEAIAKQAEEEAVGSDDESQKRKVLIFSFFEDTVAWIKEYLETLLENEEEEFPHLTKYKGRLNVVSGSDELSETSRQAAVYGFAPVSSQAPAGRDGDSYDVLISTDVLAEGMNLQQCRHIINYDLPWNPMRLVQRHGRIDRIGSPHSEVFLRTIFPEDRLDEMLELEQKIFNKLAMASASVGVIAPVEGAQEGHQVFSETRQEIEKLMREDPALFERGGTEAAAQTSEEYRHTLRSALRENRKKITELPWKSGSGMIKGKQRGFFFCALVGEPDQPPHRTYLRFVKANDDWKPIPEEGGIVREIGTCLRLIECEKDTPTYLPEPLQDAVFDFWEIARKDVFKAWMKETDPKNTQPKVRPLNKRVAEFIRENRPPGVEDKKVDAALDTLESPWPMREEKMLREWFSEESDDLNEKSKFLVEKVLETGMEPHRGPALLPPIEEDDIYLISWLAIEAEK